MFIKLIQMQFEHKEKIYKSKSIEIERIYFSKDVNKT